MPVAVQEGREGAADAERGRGDGRDQHGRAQPVDPAHGQAATVAAGLVVGDHAWFHGTLKRGRANCLQIHGRDGVLPSKAGTRCWMR
jgi:hypothetical protein